MATDNVTPITHAKVRPTEWEGVLLEIERLVRHANVGSQAARSIGNLDGQQAEETALCLSGTLRDLQDDLQQLHGTVETLTRGAP